MPTRDIDGCGYFFADQGKGLPVVLLHGFPLDSRMWEAQIGELSAGYRIIAPDLRGFGKSRCEDPFTIERLADDVHALLADLGTLPVVLGGLSMGGYVAFAFARKYPTDLRGLMLMDTRAEADNSQQKENRQKMIELARQQGSKAVADQMVPKLLAHDTPRTRPAVAQAVGALAEGCPAKTIEHALEALRDRPDQIDLLPSIAVPTLIVVGEADSITPPAVAQTMHMGISNSMLVTIRGAGHMSPMEQPAQVIQAMSRFVQGLVES